MTTTIQIYGRLGRAPQQRTTAAGKAMVTGAMVVDLGRDGEMPEWFSLVAFGTIGEVLAKHDKGEHGGGLGPAHEVGMDGPGRRGARGFLGVRRFHRERSHGTAGQAPGSAAR